ncbi:MAG: DUF1015 domain-containing protein [Planctomycetota bacterium]
MPKILPFRGLHYDWRAADPASVIAPPYDVISPSQRADLLARSPYNSVRLILPGGPDDPARYDSARRTLDEWIRRRLLVRDDEPAFYLYRQTFDVAGGRRTRTGFFAAVGLEEFGCGSIFAHEHTLAAPKEDRFRLLSATRTNLSPVLGLLEDPDSRVSSLLRDVRADAPLSFEEGGARHEFVPLTDPALLRTLVDACASRAIYIADGHHRYETALRYFRETGPTPLSADVPRSAVMMLCVPMSDPGLVILPTHRVFELPSAPRVRDLMRPLAGAMEFDGVVEGDDACAVLAERLRRETGPPSFGLLADAASKGVIGRWIAPESDRSCIAGVRLDVLVLHREIMPLLAPPPDRCVLYSHEAPEVRAEVARHPARLGVLVRPTPLDSVIRVARKGERLPPKTTFFYPKVPTALVFRPLDENGRRP